MQWVDGALAGRTASSVLVVEDDTETREALADALLDLGFDVHSHASAESAIERLCEREFASVLTDVRMAGMGGIELCRRVHEDGPGIPVVVMTAYGDLALVTAALRAGAFDFINKPFTLDHLAAVLNRAAQHVPLEPRPKALGLPAFESLAPVRNMIGSSAGMRHALSAISNAANSELPTLITGENGTGKELAARAIHDASSRAAGPFVTINCGSLPSSILAGELFGDQRGAFAGALESRCGLLAEARGGSVFLDEIGDLPLELQPQLLRVIRERVVRPSGMERELPFDARVIAATNRDLEAEVRAGRFKEGLYYRLNVLGVHLPPLRERGDDVLALARHFLEIHSATSGSVRKFTPGAEAMLVGYEWPGNVRELESFVQAVNLMVPSSTIDVTDVKLMTERSHFSVQTATPSLEDVERKHIAAALEAVGGNKVLAAKKLGIDRTTLYRKLRRLGLGNQ
ncbi:MAG TPA: sigma-54 dependent transcriptional regulator [Polyangiaceae bacterium]|nr:sigma-54 dependent transcriptional regulator [Polyangiaceae bacterium]